MMRKKKSETALVFYNKAAKIIVIVCESDSKFTENQGSLHTRLFRFQTLSNQG